MTPSTRSGQRGNARRRTFGVAPYVPGRTTAEYVADGTLRAVEADDEVAALAAYAAVHGLTLISDPLQTMGGKRVRVTLSDGREYVSRYLKAAVAEFLPPELLIEAPLVPRPTPTEAADHTPAPAPDAAHKPEGAAPEAPEPETPPPAPQEPPEFVEPDAVSRADLARLRPDLVPRSWDIAAALWGVDGDEPRSVQAVAKRFDVSPGFVRIVAASVIRLAADDASPSP